MAFRESPRFPERVGLGAVGGPSFLTDVVELESGNEQRNQLWSAARARYDVGHAYKTDEDYAELLAFFRATAVGRTHGFRFKDWTDYQCVAAAGRLGTGAVGTGLAAYQLYKRYSSGSQFEDRQISKPVSGSVSVQRNGSPVSAGAGAGQWALDPATGIITFVADVTKVINSITQANPGEVTTTTNHGFTTGDRIPLSGVVGMTQVNGVLFTITVTALDKFTLGVNTTGYTAYSSGGVASKFPQPADVLAWAGEFDVPVRFDTDRMEGRADEPNVISWPSIPLVELRV